MLTIRTSYINRCGYVVSNYFDYVDGGDKHKNHLSPDG